MNYLTNEKTGFFEMFADRRNPVRPDRRRAPRGGRRAADIVRTGGVLLLLSTIGTPTAAAQVPMRIGFDVASASKARQKGLPVSYGSLWAGAWNQKRGWGGISSQLATAKANGVTPVVHWWYWGDNISPSCVENGCYDARQRVSKNKATWYRMSNELADLIVDVMGSSETLVVLETEFNKGGIETYEPFDGYLAEHAQIFQKRNLKVVVSFGNRGRSYWKNFDRAVAASDLLGTMVLQSSIHEASTYMDGADMLVEAARYYQAAFGKPSFVTDFAFSSYPEPAYEDKQDNVVREIFARMSELRSAGVRGMVWRMLEDDPSFDTANYHGIAERYWGILRADGTEKPAFVSFRNALQGEGKPSVPTALRATPGDARATLSWGASAGADGYNVKFSTTLGGPYQTIAIGVTGTTFVHTGLVNGVTYEYVVSASNSAGESGNSNRASVTPTPGGRSSPVLTVLSPVAGTRLRGTQRFKAVLTDWPLNKYRMYWRVDGGRLNLMSNSRAGGSPHKAASVAVTSWKWRGKGPYGVEFIAKDLAGKIVKRKTVRIYVGS